MRVVTQLLLTFLLNASWQIALVVAIAAGCDWLLRGTTARYRHGLWVAALFLALALPLLSSAGLSKTLPGSKGELRPAGDSSAPIFVTTVPSPDIDSLAPRAAEKPASQPFIEPARRNFLASAISLNRFLASGLIALYGLFILYRAGQLVRAWRRTKVIVKSAKAFEYAGEVRAIIERCQIAIGVRRVSILCSPSVPVPITVGILNPVIILPARLLQDIDEEVLTTAIGHELVHVCRRDYLANLIYELIYLPLSFHPAVALVRRRIRQTRELCCDEAVATKLLRAETYARSLVRLIGSAPLGRRLAADTTIGISESDILEVRIMSLLKAPKLTARRKRLLLIAASLLLITPCVAAARLALSVNIDRQEPAVAPAQRVDEGLERRKQEQVREELKRRARALTELARVAPEPQRQEIEARLREVQENLAEHERIRQEYYQQNREEEQKRLEELRATLAQLQKSQPGDEARMKEVREKIAEMERSYVLERAREAKQQLEEVEKRAAEAGGDQAESLVLERKRRQEVELQGREERARRQAELTRGAVLSMDRAIQIATSQVPGKVLACSLGRDGDKLFYHVIIISGDGDKSTATYVWVSAIDGQILKTEKEEPRKEEEAANESAPRARISGGVLNAKAVSLPPPVYPLIARSAHASGEVTVQVTLDEAGNVVAAHAVSGHPLLQAAAVAAARQASFRPTRLNGEPVKVAGVLVYNFVAQ